MCIHTFRKHFAALSLLIFTSFLFSCSTLGTYSVILTNPGVNHEQNDLNDLPEPYHKKLVISPSSIEIMSDAARSEWLNGLNNAIVNQIDTTIKLSLLDQPGSIKLQATACKKQGIAIAILDESTLKKNGKYIHIKMRYVSVLDEPSQTWAATPYYRIDGTNDFPEGIHTIEFQSIDPRIKTSTEKPKLRNVLIVPANP